MYKILTHKDDALPGDEKLCFVYIDIKFFSMNDYMIKNGYDFKCHDHPMYGDFRNTPYIHIKSPVIIKINNKKNIYRKRIGDITSSAVTCCDKLWLFLNKNQEIIKSVNEIEFEFTSDNFASWVSIDKFDLIEDK